VLPQLVPVSMKPRVTTIDENVTVSSLNVLVTVSGRGALVLPTATLPKFSAVGLATSSCTPSRSAARAGAARPTIRSSARLKTENPKAYDFGSDMIDPPMNRAVTSTFQKSGEICSVPTASRSDAAARLTKPSAHGSLPSNRATSAVRFAGPGAPRLILAIDKCGERVSRDARADRSSRQTIKHISLRCVQHSAKLRRRHKLSNGRVVQFRDLKVYKTFP
jgi:hypothetical protein